MKTIYILSEIGTSNIYYKCFTSKEKAQKIVMALNNEATWGYWEIMELTLDE